MFHDEEGDTKSIVWGERNVSKQHDEALEDELSQKFSNLIQSISRKTPHPRSHVNDD